MNKCKKEKKECLGERKMFGVFRRMNCFEDEMV